MTIAGILPALLTAYDDAAEVSPQRTRALLERLNAVGVDGYFVTGTSGEYYLLSPEERLHVLETAAGSAEGRHVIFQVASSDQRDVRELARQAADHGATAVAASIPIYYGYGDDSLAAYYRDIREATELPLLAYTIPSFTGRVLGVDLLAELAEEGVLQGVKYTSSDLAVLARLRARTRTSATSDFSILLGSDDLLVAAMAQGADGGIGATFNLAPALYVALHRAITGGEHARAQQLQELAIGMLDALAQGEVYPVLKSALRSRGMDIGQARRPMAQHDAAEDARVAAALARVDGLEEFLL